MPDRRPGVRSLTHSLTRIIPVTTTAGRLSAPPLYCTHYTLSIYRDLFETSLLLLIASGLEETRVSPVLSGRPPTPLQITGGGSPQRFSGHAVEVTCHRARIWLDRPPLACPRLCGCSSVLWRNPLACVSFHLFGKDYFEKPYTSCLTYYVWLLIWR